jgi:hypothetical protein
MKSVEKHATWVSIARRVCQDANFVGHSNNGFHPNQGFNSGWNKPSFPFDNHQQGGNGQNFNRHEPQLRDIIRDQFRINDEFGKKIHATEKLLENISAKMDSFTVATQNQLSFYKMLETQIQQIAIALPRQSNGYPSQGSPSSLCSRERPQNLLEDLWEESVQEMP